MDEQETQFIANNEGNAWYIDTESPTSPFGDTWHAELLYIANGKANVVSFYPKGTYSYFKGVDGIDHNDQNSINAALQDAGYVWQTNWLTQYGRYNVTFISNSNINTQDVATWQKEEDKSPPWYNPFAHNCADEVRDALHAGWLDVGSNPINSPAGLTWYLRSALSGTPPISSPMTY